jgi:hypothetical protein
VFGRKPPKLPGKLEYAVEGDDLVIRYMDRGTALDVANWAPNIPESAGAIQHIINLADPDNLKSPVVVETDLIRLSAACVASLDPDIATGLHLPAATHLGLDLKPQGNIADKGFHIKTGWVRPGGQPARVTVSGALVLADGSMRRVPEPLWSIYQAAKALAEPLEQSERFRALAALRSAWPEDPFTSVEANPFLEDLRIYYASALSLKVRTLTEDVTEFDPVLFSSKSLEAASAEGRELDEDEDNILSAEAQQIFASNRFAHAATARPVYLLRQGEYVYVDPALRPLLEEVRKLQGAPEAERRNFVLNPARVFRERLGEEAAEAIGLEDRFIETTQFSARVAGVDIWRKPVLAWLTPSAQNSWLPERFGLRVGEDYFTISPDKIGPLTERFEAAIARGEQTVNVDGLLEPVTEGGAKPPAYLPATAQLQQIIKSLAPFETLPGGDAPTENPSDRPKIGEDKLFLVVRENFDEVEFSSANGPDDSTPVSFEPISQSPRLTATLKPHQVEGLNWLSQCALSGRDGALLADDMGLGKTLQAIAFMVWLQDEAKAGRREAAPFLIVAPTGLLGTWRKEIEQHVDQYGLGPLIPAFGGTLKTLREESGLTERDIQTGKAALDANAWREGGVVLTTYETMRDYHFSFAGTRFGLIAYDEIQKLKNPASQVTRAAQALNAAFTLGMTGTPVENRLHDLWSIMDVISPGYLGAGRTFEKRFPPTDHEALGRLKSLLMDSRDGKPAYMLRRLKSDELKDMPAKHIHTAEVMMPPVQANAYRDIVVRASAARSGTMGRGGMLMTLAAMRGVSLHPQDPRVAPLDINAYAADSARLSHSLTVLDDVAKRNEKALVFVEDHAMQDRLAGLIQARFGLSRPPMKINGTVPGQKRQAMVDEFQKDRDQFGVMILSPKAGGVGLTLTAANHVIHLSRWWNPAVEDQATDRVFRIGQVRDVHVYLPLAVHPDESIRATSFDLSLNALLERKRQLTRDLFLPPECDDNELEILFDEVIQGSNGVASIAEEPEIPAAPQTVEAPTEASIETPKSISQVPSPSIPKPISPPVTKQAPTMRRWKYEPYTPRTTDQILSLFAGMDIRLVHIEDPYALAKERSRNAQIRFLLELQKVSKSIEAVQVDYNPDVIGDSDDVTHRRHFNSRFLMALDRQTPRMTLVRREKRGRGGDFHDRCIRLDVKGRNGAIEQHELSLGRGAEALYDDRQQCHVVYIPPGC